MDRRETNTRAIKVGEKSTIKAKNQREGTGHQPEKIRYRQEDGGLVPHREDARPAALPAPLKGKVETGGKIRTSKNRPENPARAEKHKAQERDSAPEGSPKEKRGWERSKRPSIPPQKKRS